MKPIHNIQIIPPIILRAIINAVCKFEYVYILHKLEQPSPLLVFPSSHYSSTVWNLSPHIVLHETADKFQLYPCLHEHIESLSRFKALFIDEQLAWQEPFIALK